jgi:multicomponent Na+:H+ antiporter subunit G
MGEKRRREAMNVIVIILLAAGFLFFITTTIGILRFPDFYSRMHAAGKGDISSSLLMVLGLALYNFHYLSTNEILVSLKIILIAVFIFLASPTATHAILAAGFESGVKPWTKEGNMEGRDDDMAT